MPFIMSGYSGKAATRAIKERLNIADIVRRYVTLQRHGGRWVAPCPFHQETKPSFSVNEEEGFFYCFGCQASGDLFDFYSRINGLDFRETLEQLAAEAGITLEDKGRGGRDSAEQDKEVSLRRAALKMHELAASLYVSALAGPGGQECREYIARRKMSPEILESFGIGWAPRDWRTLADSLKRAGFSPEDGVAAGLLAGSDKGSPYDRFRGRLMFPIKNLSGRVIAFGGRIIADEDSAKYINSADSPLYKKGDNLYGLFQARRSISVAGSVMLTEGYMDVLTLHQFGYTNACGVLGTALTREQVKRLGGFCSTIELLFDGDGAGRKAALRSCEMILTRGLAARVVLMPEGEDIDSLLHGAGREAFEALRKSAPEGLDFCIRTLGAQAPRDAIDWVKNFLRQLREQQPELVSGYAARLARGLDLDERALLREDSGARSADHLQEGRQGSPAMPDGDNGWYGQPGDKGRYGKPGEKGRYGKPGDKGRYGQPGKKGAPQGQRYSGPPVYDDPAGPFGPSVPTGPTRVKTGEGGASGQELDILRFVVRYPHHVPVLREHGADFVLQSSWAKSFWEKVAPIASMGPDCDVDEVLAILDDKERDFWFRCRLETLPTDTEQAELADMCAGIERICSERQGKSCLMALRRSSSGDAYDADLLKALQETVRRKHGQH